MPDWTYQTVFRPVLRRIPFPKAQDLAFGTMGLLGRHAAGRAVIGFMGHATPPEAVAVSHGDRVFPSGCGLGCGVDLRTNALSAISLFGFGLIEVGPVLVSSPDALPPDIASQWRENGSGLSIPETSPGQTCADLVAALQSNRFRNASVVARLLIGPNDEADAVRAVVAQLAPHVDGFSIVSVPSHGHSNSHFTREQLQAVRHEDWLVLAVVSSQDVSADAAPFAQLPVDGLIVEGGIDERCQRGLLGAGVVNSMADTMRGLACQLNDKLLIASGGVQQPADAIQLLDAGAHMVMVDSGFAAAGPGLPKRINAAVSSQQISVASAVRSDDAPIPHQSWFWASLLGLSLTVGGLLSFFIGWTRVVLPYDEEYLGMLRDEICSINPQLLPFMSHDRVTLAGTMLSLGPMYLALAWFGDRRGMHWARVAVLTSAFVGFLSFFMFLGFGYFDPFHAFISAVLFQFITLCLRSSQPEPQVAEFDLENSWSWQRAMWGQLLMVIHGATILLAGCVISSFGVTEVFVSDDLDFMQTTRAALVEANPRLIPLVAHDRATFGGMLMSTGITVLLTSLWGWQRGRRWLWYALTGSGTVAYVSAIAVHWSVGYISLRHLLPAYGGLAVLWLAMLLSRPWMFEDAATCETRTTSR